MPDQDKSFMPDGGGSGDWHYLDAYTYDPLPYQGKYSGELPWAMEWIFDNIVQYLKDGNWDTAAELMGAICHFTGDATCPLHATWDYGASPGYHHSEYETAVNDHIGEISIPNNYVPQELDNITNAALVTLKDSFNFTDEDPNGGVNICDYLEVGISWNDTIKSMTENRVRAGVQFTANVWYTAMIHAGLTIQAPTLTSPSDGSTTTDNTPTFTWTSVGGTNDFQLASDNGFTSGVVTVKGLPTTSYTLVEPLTSGEWYWRVRTGDNSTDVGLWSQTRCFAVSTSHVEVVISPSYQSGTPGTTLTYTVITRNTGNVLDNYSLENSDNSGWVLMLDNNLLAIPAGENRVATLRVTIPADADNGTEDNITVTATSRIDNTVEDNASCIAHVAAAPPPPSPPPPGDTVPPPTPSLVSPANGANITDNTPLFDWSDVSDPSGVTYDIYISRDARFVSTALQKTGLTASTYELTPAEALVAGAYYWRVRAVDGAGNIGSWSENWSFAVSIAPPTPPSVEIPLITLEAPARVEVENAAITALEISVLNTVENVRITVQELVDRPGEIAIAAPGAIYRYLEIIKENITDNDIGSVTITFKVEKAWIEGENIDENTITLKRYNPENGGWVSLPTAKVSEDATYVYFSATSPGLSYFAVSGTAMTPAPAAFTVSALTISPSQVSVGEEVSISVTVKNTGDLAGTCTVTLKINGIVEDTENVTLAGGATRVVTFTISEDTEGTYNINVNGQTGAFTVVKPTPAPTRWPLIAGIVGAIAIIGIVAAVYIRRR
jgi:PGF-pre-PGF domain-containing protein